MFAQLQVEMAKRGVKLMALTTHNTPVNKAGTEYRPHEEWVRDVNELGNADIQFPIVDDEDGSISQAYHMFVSIIGSLALPNPLRSIANDKTL